MQMGIVKINELKKICYEGAQNSEEKKINSHQFYTLNKIF